MKVIKDMNAKEEFLRRIINKRVQCAEIVYDDSEEYIVLPVGYTGYEYDQFLSKLDFDYDSSYGMQQLFGTIWFDDGSWAERGEYDGSEWWELKIRPELSDRVNASKKKRYTDYLNRIAKLKTELEELINEFKEKYLNQINKEYEKDN